MSASFLRSTALTATLLAAALIGAAPDAARAAYPERPITMVVAYPAGGNADLVGRLAAEGLARRMNANVVVENEGGAAGVIAASKVARAAPDGYTILLAGVAMYTILPYMQKISYDWDKDFTPLFKVSDAVRILAINPRVPAKTMSEFIAYGKANPGKLNYGSPGVGSLTHLLSEALAGGAGFKVVHIPYRGAAPALQDLLAGEINFFIDPSVIPHVQSGGLIALGVAGEKRSPALPDLPTFGELGYPNIRTSGWQGVLGPARMPAEIVNRLATEMEAISKEAEFQRKLYAAGFIPLYRAPKDFAADIREDNASYGKLIKDLDIKAE